MKNRLNGMKKPLRFNFFNCFYKNNREHDKFRGQYEKITEPKTPYNYDEIEVLYLILIEFF